MKNNLKLISNWRFFWILRVSVNLMNKFIIRGNISNRVLSLIYLFPSSPPSSFDFSISTFSLLPDANLRISSLKVRRENTVYSKLDVLRLVTFPPIPTNAYEVCITIVPPLWRQANESPLRITFSLPSPPPPPPLCASKTGSKLMRRGRWTVVQG